MTKIQIDWINIY